MPTASDASASSGTSPSSFPAKTVSSPGLAALADALAGALGSIISMLAFYPVDIAKTRAQAALTSPTSTRPTLGHGLGFTVGPTKIALPTVFPTTTTTGAADGAGGGEKRWFLRSRTLAALVSILRQEERGVRALRGLYEGVAAKSLQTIVGSFVYFYVYTLIKGVMRRRTGAAGAGPKNNHNLSPSLNLLAAALAGAVNQIFTLPLENITTKMQVQQQTVANEGGSPTPRPCARNRVCATGTAAATLPYDGGVDGMTGSGQGTERCEGAHQVGLCDEPHVVVQGDTAEGRNGGGDGGESVSDRKTTSWEGYLWMLPFGNSARKDEGREEKAHNSRSLEQSSDRDKTMMMAAAVKARGRDNAESTERGRQQTEHQETRQSPQPPKRRRQRPRTSLTAVALNLYREGNGMTRFWRGFAPSLVLTCNPAINYTAFDLLKAFWLKRRITAVGADTLSSGRSPSLGGQGGNFLDPLEAFVVAAAAKCLATMITYPLIRAKVVLMTSTSDPFSSGGLPPPHPLQSFPTTPVTTATIQTADTDVVASEPRGAGDGGPCDPPPLAAGERLTTPEQAGGILSPAPVTLGESLMEAGGVFTVPETAGGRNRDVRSVDNCTSGIGAVLVEIVRREGLGGLYAGCGAQLVHTILKSALLLATKEQIARAAASAVFLGGNSSRIT